MKKLFVILLIVFGGFSGYWLVQSETHTVPPYRTDASSVGPKDASKAEAETVVTTELPVLPRQKVLATDYHIFQSFNNCAPAALSLAFSYYDIRVSQEELMAELRPFNHPKGKNDDKSTPPDELADEAREYGLIAYYRGGGDIEMIKKFINAGLPVIVRTLLYTDKDYAHYRVVKGYDDSTEEIIQDDSLEGKNLRFSYEKWNRLWRPYNYAYLVLARPEQKELLEQLLGDSSDEKTSWQKAENLALSDIAQNIEDRQTWFNLAVARYYTGDYAGSIDAFEMAEPMLAKYYLWYQIEPIRSYYELDNYDRVFELTNRIITPTNAAWTELYMIRGESYLRMGDTNKAKAEFEKAVYYNVNYQPAHEALKRVE